MKRQDGHAHRSVVRLSQFAGAAMVVAWATSLTQTSITLASAEPQAAVAAPPASRAANGQTPPAGARGTGPAHTVRTSHLTVQAAARYDDVSPGGRVFLDIEVTPRRGMHVYAPGKHDYQVVRFTVEGRPWLQAQPLRYPPSEIYHFVPLDERVETYQKAFTLVQDLTILATPEARKLLAGQKTVTVGGQLEYQACDDKICYAPAKVPLTFTLALTPLLRQ